LPPNSSHASWPGLPGHPREHCGRQDKPLTKSLAGTRPAMTDWVYQRESQKFLASLRDLFYLCSHNRKSRRALVRPHLRAKCFPRPRSRRAVWDALSQGPGAERGAPIGNCARNRNAWQALGKPQFRSRNGTPPQRRRPKRSGTGSASQPTGKSQFASRDGADQGDWV
jgi:hypothetical protein